MNHDIEKALHDISFIKDIINDTNNDNDMKFNGITLKANIFIQFIALLAVLCFLGMELFSNYSMSHTLLLTNTLPELKIVGISLIGFTLVGLLGALYFILWRAAQYNNEPVNQYIVRHFKYLSKMAFFSDLLVKFITLSLVMLAQKSQWVAPLLLLFTADYLLQSRFFIISTKCAMVLGSLFVVGSLVMFFHDIFSLVYPLTAFGIATGISLWRLMKRKLSLHNKISQL